MWKTISGNIHTENKQESIGTMLDAFKQTVKLFCSRISIWLLMGIMVAFLMLFSPPWWIVAVMLFAFVVLTLFVCTLVVYSENQIREEFAIKEALRMEDKEQLERINVCWTEEECHRLERLKLLNEQFFEASEITCTSCKTKIKACRCIGSNVHYICPQCDDGFVIDLSELKTTDNA